MKVKFSVLMMCLSLLFTTSSLAEPSEAFVGVGLHTGNGSVKGDLENTSDVSVGGTEVLFGVEEKKGKRFHSFFSMPFTNVIFQHSNDRFPFEQEKLTVFRAAIIPNVCYKVVWEVSGCLGIGFENIEIRDDSNTNNQKYGTIGAQVRVGRFSGSGVIGGVVLDYFEIEEKRNGVRSKSSFMPMVAMLGYQFQIQSK